MQQFKSVYFVDYPAESARRRNLKLAFGPGDAALYGALKPLSSEGPPSSPWVKQLQRTPVGGRR